MSGLTKWIFHSDAGLLLRIAVGCVVFGTLAVVDYRRNGRSATRWREYAVLLAAVLTASAYGAVNDQLTCAISPEYFLYGKELAKSIGDAPAATTLHWEAAKVGLKATWSAGLIVGVALLLANNPLGHLPRLKNRTLLRMLPVVLVTTAVCGTLGGWLGYNGHLVPLSSDFKDMVEANIFRPRRFMCTWGIHLGGYVGGFLGTILAAVWVIYERRSRTANHDDVSQLNDPSVQTNAGIPRTD